VKSADGSAHIFLRWFKLAQIRIEVTGPHNVTSIQICASSPQGLLKLRVPTKVTSKRISQANYFYRTSISRASTHPQYWNLIHIKYPIIKFFYCFMKLSFPVIQCPYVLFRNIRKTFAWKYAKKHEEKSKPSGQKTVLFLMRSCSIQILVLHSDNDHIQNRHHVICGLAHGDDQNFSKIVMIKEINQLTLCGCVR